MSISFRCPCGKQSDLPESFLGKRVRCNFCGALSIVAEQARTEAREPDWETHIAESLLTGPSVAGGSSSTGILEAEAMAPPASMFDEVPSGEVAEVSAEPSAEVAWAENPKQYKVLTQRDKWFGGKFDAERFEEAINFFARQGWVVRSMAAGSIGGFTGSREELVVLMERG